MNSKEYHKEGREQLRKELEEEIDTPILANMNKTNPFKVPENYFSSLEDKVMQQLKPQMPQVQQLPTFKEQMQYIWDTHLAFFFTGRVVVPVFASLIVLVVSFVGFHHAMVNSANYAMGNTPANSTEASIELSGITKEELSSYVISHSDEFDLSDVDQATLSSVAENYKMKDIIPGTKDAQEMDDASSIEDML